MQINTRQVALKILEDVENGAYFNLSLKKHLRDMPLQDKRFVSALCFSVLENLILIDFVIRNFCGNKRIHRMVKNVLRLGIGQILFLDRIPDSAAVNESVKLIAASPKRQLKGFVNAVLREVVNNRDAITYPNPKEEPANYLSVKYSYPVWMVDSFLSHYGFDFVEALFAYRKQNAATSIRVNRLKTSIEEVKTLFDQQGVIWEKGALPTQLYVQNIENVEDWALFHDGYIAVQGLSSMLSVVALDVKKEDRVLDACAAPGGKSAFLYEFHPQSLVCMDLHAHRVHMMEENFKRLGVMASCKTADASIPIPAYYDQFDKVFLDAPCSATGLFYRKPDMKTNKEPSDIKSLQLVQRELLETCSRYVKKGGALLYATCSIMKEENEQNVDWFLKRHVKFSCHTIENLPAQYLSDKKNTGIQLFPHLHHTDGFYFAKLVRET